MQILCWLASANPASIFCSPEGLVMFYIIFYWVMNMLLVQCGDVVHFIPDVPTSCKLSLTAKNQSLTWDVYPPCLAVIPRLIAGEYPKTFTVFSNNKSITNIILSGCLLLYATRRQSSIVWCGALHAIVREFARLFTSIYADRKIPIILTKINQYDKQYGWISKNRSGLRYYLQIYIIFYLNIIILANINMIYYGFTIQNISKNALRYMTTIFPLMYLVLCDELIFRFQDLEKRWRTIVYETLNNKTPFSTEKLETERLAHSFLCNILEEIRSIFGLRLATYVFFVFQEHLIRFYFSIYFKSYMIDDFSKNEKLFYSDILFFITHSWIGIFFITSFSEKLTLASKTIMSHLRSIPIWKLSKESVDQMTISLATYIIVIIQLSPDLNRIFKN
ncbi:uncharacterized protein LOC126902522 isoform X2 [Daktulosphaira vitifoliae]|uniref:uncharacterized protein LOC126902522 isoform X2 n=1 Tax=Daktulosphaira vitifoliae TaxID=58002 RepID=UPI0021AAD08D|nr:uncharacterized protein LOC126902522 isoform X2 [Daktulosphaira vitifoliae]